MPVKTSLRRYFDYRICSVLPVFNFILDPVTYTLHKDIRVNKSLVQIKVWNSIAATRKSRNLLIVIFSNLLI